jgi:serine/threonine protein kinase
MTSKRIASGANGILFVDPSSQRTRSIRKRTNHAQPQLQTLKQLYKIDPDHIVQPLSQQVQTKKFTWKDYLNPHNYIDILMKMPNKQYTMQYLHPDDGWYPLQKYKKPLSQLRYSNKRVDEIRKKWIQNLQDAVKTLHKKKWTHNDLHSGNVMVNIKTGEVKIIDVGWARKFTEQEWKRRCLENSYPNFSDLWSVEAHKYFLQNPKAWWEPPRIRKAAKERARAEC